MTRARVAAAIQTAGLASGIAAGFVIDTAVGLACACVALLLVGVSLERR